MLTDDQCDEFRRLPCSFNDMVRAIYKAGYKAGVEDMDTLIKLHKEKNNDPTKLRGTINHSD